MNEVDIQHYTLCKGAVVARLVTVRLVTRKFDWQGNVGGGVKEQRSLPPSIFTTEVPLST